MLVCKVKCVVTETLIVSRMFGSRKQVYVETKFLTREAALELVSKGARVRVPEQRHKETVPGVGDSVRIVHGAHYCSLYFEDVLPLLPSDWP